MIVSVLCHHFVVVTTDKANGISIKRRINANDSMNWICTNKQSTALKHSNNFLKTFSRGLHCMSSLFVVILATCTEWMGWTWFLMLCSFGGKNRAKWSHWEKTGDWHLRIKMLWYCQIIWNAFWLLIPYIYFPPSLNEIRAHVRKIIHIHQIVRDHTWTISFF